MKRIFSMILLALSFVAGAQTFTGGPAACADAPEWEAGQKRYFNLTPGGQQGNVVVVKQNGLPGLWNNQLGGWIMEPGKVKEMFFATGQMLFAVNTDGRSGFTRLHGLDTFQLGEVQEPWYPFDEVNYYPSRSNMQYICVRMQSKWAVLGPGDFLLPACWDSPDEAISYLIGDHRKPAGEDPAAFIMRYFMNMGTTSPKISAIGREPGKWGVLISLEDTPYGGPYYLPAVAPGDALYLEYAAFCVKDGYFCLSNALFSFEDGSPLWYDDDSAVPPIIPLNQVTLKAAHYPATRGSDGGLYFGPGSETYGLWLKKDGTFMFGWVPLYYKWDSQTYIPFDHQDSYVDDWRIPTEMGFHEFYFGYDLASFLANRDGYDQDAIMEKARKIYLKHNFEFTERYPMSAEGYDTSRKALKMVFAEQVCPPIWIPMTEAEAKALLASVKKYGVDNHAWYYTRGLDAEGYDIVLEAVVGYDRGKVFRYKAPE